MDVTIRTEFDLGAANALYGVDADELVQRLAGSPRLGWWFAYDGHGDPVGVMTASLRPDERVFVVDRLHDETLFAPLLEQALNDLDGTINVTVRAGQATRLDVVEQLGLRDEMTSVEYAVPFAPALDALTFRPARGIELRPVFDVDRDELYALDIALRNDVPGNDGWQGNREWFDDELSSTECDPAGYLVAVDRDSGELIGLCRMWRNPDGPTLGLLGVRRDRRHGFVALALLRTVVEASSTWGWPTFSTHTARPALQRRLDRIGAERSGGFVRFVRP